MSDRDTRAAGLSTGYPIVPVPAPEGTLSGEPPPYSACVPYPPAINSNYPDPRSPIHTNPSGLSPLYGPQQPGPSLGVILHDTAASVPIFDVSPRSGNDDAVHIPRTTPYNPQPSYNPTYMADQRNSPLTNVYGKKTILLQRTDAENSARQKKRMIAMCAGLLIGCLIPIITLACILTAVPRRTRRVEISRTDAADDLSHNNAYDNRFLDNSRAQPIDPYLTDGHKDKSDDFSWKPKSITSADNPFLGDKYKDRIDEKPARVKSEEDIFRELGIVVPKFDEKLKDIWDWTNYDDKFSKDPVIKPIELSDEMKEILGISRENKKGNKLSSPN